LNTGAKHEYLQEIHAVASHRRFWGIGEKSPNYHCDSMLRGGPSMHFLEAPDTWIPPDIASVEHLALHYFLPLQHDGCFVDTIFGKGDTLDR
jgi:hypothetical protein